MASSDMASGVKAIQKRPDIELGLAACLQQQETIGVKLNILDARTLEGIEDSSNLEQEDIRLRRLFREAGEGIWTLHARGELAKPLMSQSAPWDKRNLGTALSVMELYQTLDQTGSTSQKNFKQRPKNWRRDILRYYDGITDTGNACGQFNWCHATGRYYSHKLIKAARVVPHFSPRGRLVGSILFGSRFENLDGPQNGLLLCDDVKHLLDKHSLLIVPADPNEVPTKRWRIDVIDNDIKDNTFGDLEPGSNLHGRELKFLNGNRPAAQFMYFRFFISMIRIRELRRQNWTNTWTRYFVDCPFPTLNPYIREKMQYALAGHYKDADVGFLARWMKDYEFQDNWYLTPLETAEAARIVLDYTDAQENGHASDDDDDDDTESCDPTSDTDSDTTLVA